MDSAEDKLSFLMSFYNEYESQASKNNPEPTEDEIFNLGKAKNNLAEAYRSYTCNVVSRFITSCNPSWSMNKELSKDPGSLLISNDCLLKTFTCKLVISVH